MVTTTPRPGAEPDPRRRSGLRADLAVIGLAVVLVAAAIAVGAYLNANGMGRKVWSAAPPLFGRWSPHVSLGSIAAVLVAIAVIAWGPGLAARLAWRPALTVGYLAAVTWTFSLTLIDGFDKGFAGRLDTPFEYLHEVPRIDDTAIMLREFTDRILLDAPGNWTVHVSGHPPGATLVFVWLDRLGLSGGAWAAVFCVLLGGLITVAVPVAVRALAGADAARKMLPFAVLFPGAVWIGVSADGLFAGVAAVGIALLTLATTASGARQVALAAGSGLVLGFCVFLSYGLLLLGGLAIAVVIYRHAWRVLAIAIAAALLVAAIFALYGFWWFDGYLTVLERYYQGIAADREYWYWVWANLAAQVFVIGPAILVALRRCWPRSTGRHRIAAFLPGNRRVDPALVLVRGALLAIIAADVSGLSMAETERIWLPFTVWLLPAVVRLPERHLTAWLAAQATLALAVNHVLATNW